MTKRANRRLYIVVSALALVAAACGGNAGGSSGSGAGASITISGSSTVEPISGANAEKYASVNPNVQMSVDGPGTGDGFELFCNGDTDISDASRPIDPEEEVPACEKNGVEFIELKVAVDGITVLTSPENDEVECLSFQDLYALLGPEAEGFDDWSDANALGKKVGGSGDYPDAPLEVTAPGEESGTFDSFAELVLEGISVEQGISEDGPFVRPDYQASADDNVIIQGVAENPTSLGWVGYAFFAENTETVKALQIEAEEGAGCVEPTFETISEGEYPIARDLYIYVNAAKAEQKPALADYVDFYLSDDGLTTVSEVGYVDLPQDAIEETRSVWAERLTGSREVDG
ncbi:MAG: phosphate ABC transporter substrate-binding protein PstS family protein [Actinomycetota bacterium]